MKSSRTRYLATVTAVFIVALGFVYTGHVNYALWWSAVFSVLL